MVPFFMDCALYDDCPSRVAMVEFALSADLVFYIEKKTRILPWCIAHRTHVFVF